MKSAHIGSIVITILPAVSENMAINTQTDSLTNHNSSRPAIFCSSAIMTCHVPLLSSVKDDVSIESVARYFGGNNYTPDKTASDRIRSCIERAFQLVDIKATYTLFPVSGVISAEKVILEKGPGLSLPECITDPGVSLVAAVIGTLGEGLEEHCRDLANNGEIYESTLFDAVGTVMLDLMGEKICEAIAEVGNQYGLVKGSRFAPGIEGYPLEQQRQLFQMADNESIRVSLNSSAIMIPTKSISFFIMLTKTAVKGETKNKCSSCRLRNCEYRILPKKE